MSAYSGGPPAPPLALLHEEDGAALRRTKPARGGWRRAPQGQRAVLVSAEVLGWHA